MARNYRKEYDDYHSTRKAKDNRNKCNKARRKKELAVGDPREVDHKKPLSKGGSNSKSNLRVVSRTENRKKYDKDEYYKRKEKKRKEASKYG
jgi:5-methylcytosine-specific restriction endonuclease McrA